MLTNNLLYYQTTSINTYSVNRTKNCEKVLAMQLRLHFESNNSHYENLFAFWEENYRPTTTSLAISKFIKICIRVLMTVKSNKRSFIDLSFNILSFWYDWSLNLTKRLLFYTKSHWIDKNLPIRYKPVPSKEMD